MGSGASGFKSEEEALKAGKTQEDIDAWKKANLKPKLVYFPIPGRAEVVRTRIHITPMVSGGDINKLFLCRRFAS